MLNGTNGQKMPADVSGATVTVDLIATGVAEAICNTERRRKMTVTTSDPLSGLLFGQEGQPTLVNLKMLRGDGNVTEEELKAEAHSAIAQVRLNRSQRHNSFPEDNAALRVNVNELASKL